MGKFYDELFATGGYLCALWREAQRCMKFDADIWIESVAAWFPSRKQTVANAVSEGILSHADALLTGVVAVPVADNIAAPEMAIRAADSALDRADRKAAEVDLLIHSWLYYQGHDLWSPPHYIANQLGATNCLPIAIHQGCDGGALALQIAALRLSAVEQEQTALVTSADRFAAPGIDRWNCQPSLALGDCGTAIVMSTSADRPSPFRLEAIGTRTTVAFEVMNRGSAPFNDYPLASGLPADFREVTDEAIEMLGQDFVFTTARSQVRTLLFETLAEAGVTDIAKELDVIALPRVGTNTLEAIYLPEFETLRVRKLRFDSTSGHLGCSDWAADLNALYEGEIVEPGKYAVLIGAGGGFTWMCAVVKAFEE